MIKSITSQFTVVFVANDDSDAKISYEIKYSESSMKESFEKAINHAKSLWSGYKYIAIGPTNDAMSMREINALLNPLWANGGLTLSGKEWFK